jgi:hypothetical protein
MSGSPIWFMQGFSFLRLVETDVCMVLLQKLQTHIDSKNILCIHLFHEDSLMLDLHSGTSNRNFKEGCMFLHVYSYLKIISLG